jgi:hypothetical protein
MGQTKQPAKTILNELPPLLPIDAVADLLALKRRSINRLIREGRLTATKLTRSNGRAGRRLVLTSSVEALIVAGMDDSSA